MSAPRTDRAAARVLSPRFLRITAANFCFFMTFATFFLLPLRIRELGGTDRDVGLVMGLNGVSGLAGVFVVGALIDRFGCRIFLRLGLLGMSASALAFAFVDRVGPMMMVLRALQGLAFAAGFNASSTLAAAFAPRDRRAQALGLFGVSTLTTHALAPTIGEQVVRLRGFPFLFAGAACFALAGLLVAWTLPDTTAAHAERAAGERRPPFSRLLRSVLVATGLCGVAFGSVMTFTPTFALDEHLGPVATFFLSYTSAAIAIRLWAGRVADDVGLRRMILPAMAGLAAAILGLAAVHGRLGFGAAGVAFGLAQGVVYPTLNAFAVGLAGPDDLGRVQSSFNGCFNIGVTSGSLALGPVVHDLGHRTMFTIASVTALAALAIFARASRAEPG
ncbi:MAG: MFS transporter [Deltaproteobacteria bacterium]